jgi:hypothetical protein
MIAALFTQAGARIACLFNGHRRGKRINQQLVKCPRCGAEWERKEKVKA